MLCLDKPMLGELKVELRPYQIEAIEAIRNEFKRGVKSTLIVLATGLGKTITFGMISRLCLQKGNRCLVLAHRGELIDQAVNKLDLLGVEASIEKAQSHARWIWEPDCVVASVQTMKGDRLQSWPPDYFDLIVTDEAHHAVAESYQRIYKHFEKALHLGVTATADRADDDEIGSVFESVAYEYNLFDAMVAPEPGPYLCRLKFTQCDLEIDLRDIRTTGGDCNQADLERVITPLCEKIANAVRQEIGDRMTLAFTPDVGSAQALASALNGVGIKADWVSGDDSARKQKIEALSSRSIQVLCNCALLTEGFDLPPIAAIVLCRPTKSRPLYAQMVGRGTRLSPGKEDCLIVDFNYLTAKHDLVKPVELFDSSHTDSEVLEIAGKLIEEEKGLDLKCAIEEAERIHRERTVLEIKARERKIDYQRIQYDPLSVYKAVGLPWRGPKEVTVNFATRAQVDLLAKLKVDGAEKMSKTRASTMIDYLIERRKNNLATHKQVANLIANGIEPEIARKMTFPEASRQLDRIFGQRRRA